MNDTIQYSEQTCTAMYGGEGLCRWSGQVMSTKDSAYESHCRYNESALSSATVASVLTCLVAALGLATLIRVISWDWILAHIFSKNPSKRNYREILAHFFQVLNVRKKVTTAFFSLPESYCDSSF